jgi:hypothetical protein
MTRLETLLDEGAAALLAGDLAALARLAPEIEAASVDPFDRAGAERLHAKAQRNARLLQAASRGVRAARQRVTEILHGPTLTTYDAHGRKASFPAGGTAPRRV